jgi:O-antigen/teichoic acid export membrane protein
MTAAALGVVTNLLLARLLGAHGLGLYAAAFATVTLVSVFTLGGVPTALVRLLSRYRHRGQADAVRGCLLWAYAQVAALSLAAAGLGALAITETGILTGAAQSTYLWALAVLPLIGIVAVQAGVMHGFEHVIAAQLPAGIVRPAVFALLLMLWIVVAGDGHGLAGRAGGPATAMALLAAAFACTIVVGGRMSRRYSVATVGSAGPKPAVNWKRWSGLALSLTSAQLAFVVMQQASLIVLPIVSEAVEAGLMRIALTASILAGLPLAAARNALAPAAARLFASGEGRQLQALATASSRLSLLACLPIALPLVLAGGDLLALAAGEGFRAAYPALILLTLAQVCHAGCGAVGIILQMTGHERGAAADLGVAAGIQVLLVCALAPQFGALGAAAAHFSGTIVMCVLLVRRVRRTVGIDPTIRGAPPGTACGTAGHGRAQRVPGGSPSGDAPFGR